MNSDNRERRKRSRECWGVGTRRVGGVAGEVSELCGNGLEGRTLGQGVEGQHVTRLSLLSMGDHNVFFFSLESIAMRVEKRTMTSNYFSNRTFYYLLRIFSRNKVHNMTTKSKAC